MKPTLAEKLKTARKKSGLKQSDIAERIGVKNNTISNWETGVAKPDIETFVTFCKVCSVDYKEILTEVYGDSVEPRQSMECSAREADMIRKFRSLDERAQKVILRNLNAEYEDVEKNLVEDTSIEAGVG